MVTPAIQTVVLVQFPFSDLTATKLRPALVLAAAGRNDWVLCQLTSNPYADTASVRIDDADFISGTLQRPSFARPGKLFTANTALITAEIGKLKPNKHRQIIAAVVALLEGRAP
ncbi:MAG: type II toxin-antitoxin system PemK/MazF family toxin [Verrucomicrobia bacterium]|nr:type II toxin-antitoxin system PemK/MazF family toxin [Verrucomicrobiota bacterium]